MSWFLFPSSAVLAWAMLRDQKDWDPNIMIRTTQAFGGKLPLGEQEFAAMKPKECRHKRKRRLANEKAAAAKATSPVVPAASQPLKNTNAADTQTDPNPKPRRARKLVRTGRLMPRHRRTNEPCSPKHNGYQDNQNLGLRQDPRRTNRTS